MSTENQFIVLRAKSVLYEFGAIFVIGLFVVSFFTFLDITFHDNYVKPVIAECYSENQSKFCSDIRSKMNLPKTAQLDIGNVYWNQLASNAVFAGFILAIVRLLFACLLKHLYRKKITPTTIMMIITYGLVGSGLFLFGFLDTFYYWFQSEDIPDSLEWLDSAGIFSESKSWTGTKEHVEILDLYLTNFVGLLIIGSLLLITMKLYAESRMINGLA